MFSSYRWNTFCDIVFCIHHFELILICLSRRGFCFYSEIVVIEYVVPLHTLWLFHCNHCSIRLHKSLCRYLFASPNRTKISRDLGLHTHESRQTRIPEEIPQVTFKSST